MGSGFKFWISLAAGLGFVIYANTSDAQIVHTAADVVQFTPDESLQLNKDHLALGKKAGFSLEMTPNAEDSGVLTEIFAKLFGEDRSVLEAAAKSTNLIEGETELTVAGMRIWNDRSAFKDGAYTYTAGIPTTQSRLKVLAVPVGPVTVQVDAGLAYEVNLESKLAPFISIPIQFTSLEATLATNAEVAGFVEGYAQFLFLRGGVGGQVDLINGRAAVTANLGLHAQSRSISYSGYLETLRGRIYAFADIFNLFRGRWRRMFDPTLADWKGFCFQLSNQAVTESSEPESSCEK